MRFSVATYTAPSGVFTPVALSPSDLTPGSLAPIHNPTVLDPYTASYGVLRTFDVGSDEVGKAGKKYGVCRAGKKWWHVSEKQFDRYSEELEKLTSRIARFQPHCSLAPLRGAAKPAVAAEVMSRGVILYEFFDFRDNSNPLRQPKFMQDLKEILARRDPGQEEYRINVTDTSRGGFGINVLVSLMARVKESVARFKNQNWLLDLNLINDQPSKVHLARIQEVRDKKPERFEVHIHLYKVPDLIVEDVKPALSFELEWDGERRIFLPQAVAGRFLYTVGDQVNLVETDNCYLASEELGSRSITNLLITSPTLRQIGAVWDQYQEK